MADESTANVSGPTSTVAEGKGKEKAPIVQDLSMDEEEESSEGEEAGEDEVPEEPEEEDEDNMEEIDTENIISDGRRTRGKQVDWSKAAQENPAEEGEDDDDDDEDFHAKDEGDDSLMQE